MSSTMLALVVDAASVVTTAVGLHPRTSVSFRPPEEIYSCVGEGGGLTRARGYVSGSSSSGVGRGSPMHPRHPDRYRKLVWQLSMVMLELVTEQCLVSRLVFAGSSVIVVVNRDADAQRGGSLAGLGRCQQMQSASNRIEPGLRQWEVAGREFCKLRRRPLAGAAAFPRVGWMPMQGCCLERGRGRVGGGAAESPRGLPRVRHGEGVCLSSEIGSSDRLLGDGCCGTGRAASAKPSDQ